MQADQPSSTPALPIKSQTVNIFSFAGHKVSVSMQLCLTAGKQPQTSGHNSEMGGGLDLAHR